MPASKLILDHIYDNESKHASKVYMTQPTGGGKTVDYTWAEAVDQSRRMATYLKSLNLPAGSRIAMVSKNCAHFIMAEMAIWMAGHVTVALYPTINAETASYVFEHSEAALVFVGKLDTWDEIEPGVPADLPRIAFPLAPPNDYTKWDDLTAANEPLQGRTERKGDEMALLLYTSGSTGRPKGVMHSFQGISDAAEGIVRGVNFTSSDRVLSYLPLAHVFERAYIEMSSFVAAHHVFFAESLDTFVEDLKRAHPTLFISVPRLWLKFQLGVFKKMPPGRLDFLLKVPILNNIIRKRVLEGLGLDAVRLAGSGSAPIPAELIAWYRNLGLNLLEGYAMSEDFAYSHLSTIEFTEPGYVGVPYDDVDVRISDIGEILIKSPGAMMGYYKQPELTAESFTDDGFFRTGDKGTRRSDGMLKITGRVKEIFKTSKGKYVAPAPIENILNNHTSVELSCVSGSGQPMAYAQVLLAEDIRPKMSDPAVRKQVTSQLEGLLAEVNRTVEHHEQLAFLAVVAEEWTTSNGFLTPTMKIRRGAIEDATSDKIEGWYGAGEKVVWA
jgi:long-subunit acyl-CoA synthetase (AMP-forming)